MAPTRKFTDTKNLATSGEGARFVGAVPDRRRQGALRHGHTRVRLDDLRDLGLEDVARLAQLVHVPDERDHDLGDRVAAGQLLRDKQLYENINQTVLELREFLAEVKKDPKKYLNVKVSIF